MKKFNKKEIMTKAWELYRACKGTFAECLHKAWENAKAIIKALVGINEECHTWYAWKLLGYEVIHESKALVKVVVEDAKTKSGTRILSYFGASQVAPIEA